MVFLKNSGVQVSEESFIVVCSIQENACHYYSLSYIIVPIISHHRYAEGNLLYICMYISYVCKTGGRRPTELAWRLIQV